MNFQLDSIDVSQSVKCVPVHECRECCCVRCGFYSSIFSFAVLSPCTGTQDERNDTRTYATRSTYAVHVEWHGFGHRVCVAQHLCIIKSMMHDRWYSRIYLCRKTKNWKEQFFVSSIKTTTATTFLQVLSRHLHTFTSVNIILNTY